MFAKDDGAAHEPTFRGVKVRARVQRAAVVPEDEVAWSPHAPVEEFILFQVIQEMGQQRVTVMTQWISAQML